MLHIAPTTGTAFSQEEEPVPPIGLSRYGTGPQMYGIGGNGKSRAVKSGRSEGSLDFRALSVFSLYPIHLDVWGRGGTGNSGIFHSGRLDCPGFQGTFCNPSYPGVPNPS